MKFVLCRPIGGLNDMLNQIEKCCQYGDKYNRIVLVQTCEKFHPHFGNPFSRYFISLQKELVFIDKINSEIMDGLSVLPTCLSGQIGTYKSLWIKDLGIVEEHSGEKITFDFNKDHDEDILVHHQAGGGKRATFALSRMRLHDSIVDGLFEKLSLIGSPYPAVHVRHTDILSDYSKVMDEIAGQSYGKLFLATDNRKIVREFREVFKETVIFNFSDLPEQEGKPVHLQNKLTPSERHSVNQQAITDLLLLAFSSNLHTNDHSWFVRPDGSEIPQHDGGGYSGLARALHSNPSLTQTLIQRRFLGLHDGQFFGRSGTAGSNFIAVKALVNNPIPMKQQARELLQRNSKELKDLLSKIHPVKTDHNLIRIGGRHDGGYLVPDDLKGISVCYSPGVGNTSAFENDLYQNHSISSHLADGSVQSPPLGGMVRSFAKRNLGALNDESTMTLEHWVNTNSPCNDSGDLLLQMDIEGAEYDVLLSTPLEVLKRFRILAIEFHGGHRWANKDQSARVVTILERLETLFYVVHNHPNNCCGIDTVAGVEVPRVFELTFLRRDRAEMLGYCNLFPHPLDSPNLAKKPDIILPRDCYR